MNYLIIKFFDIELNSELLQCQTNYYVTEDSYLSNSCFKRKFWLHINNKYGGRGTKPTYMFMVIIPLLVIELKATPNGNPSNDFYWRQKSSSLNIVQYNTTSRPIIIHLQIYIA